MANNGWIGVDLDATLAEYDGFKGPGIIGAPVPRMVNKVQQWLAEGREVRIFTARVYTDGSPARNADANAAREAIIAWTEKYIGTPLKVTCTKDYSMVVLYDDRAKQVTPNTGRVVGDDDYLVPATPRMSKEDQANRIIGEGIRSLYDSNLLPTNLRMIVESVDKAVSDARGQA